MFALAFAAVFVFLLQAPVNPENATPVTLRYTIVSNAKVAGSEVDAYSGDGRIDSTFEFNDRGRGPKLSAHYVLGSDGLPQQTDIQGNDYLKAPVEEHFAMESGVPHWRSTSENGQSSSPGFYISNNGPAAESAFLVNALLRSTAGFVKLLPGGEARLEKLTEVTLDNGKQKLHLTEYAITGLSYEPQTLWLDDDHRLFGFPGKWFALLREGWEESNDRLYAFDRAAADARYTRLAKDLAQHSPHAVAVEHVRLFDSVNAIMREEQTVVFDRDRIATVGPANSVRVPDSAQRIDGHGKTLLPGLFDMHAHAQAIDGLLNIASGVTSIRDMGNDIDELKHLDDRWTAGEAIGPRVWKAGFIDGRGPFQAPTGLYADNLDEARAAVNRYADSGYIQIKVYSSLKPELVPEIVKTAHARGLRVSGHMPNGMIARQFVEEGGDEIQHINFIFLNFLGSEVKDTRTPERFTAVGSKAATLDLNSREVNEFIDLLRLRHTTVDVTLAAFEGMFTGRPGKVSPDYAPVLDRLPAQVQRGAYTGGLPVSRDTDQLYKDSYAAMLRMTKKMYDAGIPILAGTDATAGIMLHRELELEVQAGIPAMKALQIATFNAARLLKQGRDLGSIEPGKRADFLLVSGNPAENIGDIRRCRLVMKDGVLYDSTKVYGAVGIRPSVD